MERRYTVWVGGGEMNDNYLTHKEAISLADNCRATGYDDVVIEEMKGSITASSFIEWYFSDEDDYRDLGRDVVFNLKTNGYFNITVKELFDSCGYIKAQICTVFDIEDPNIDEDYEFQPEDLIFIDDITTQKTCYDCRHQYTGDLDFCPKCLTCVS